MSTEIKVPPLGESISEAIVLQWLKKEGDAVGLDEPIVELETDKVTLEMPSPVAGVLQEILAGVGDTLDIGAVIAIVAEGAQAAPAEAETPKSTPAKVAPAKVAPAKVTPAKVETKAATPNEAPHLSPAVSKMVKENNLDASAIAATGPKGNITVADVQEHMKKGASPSPAQPSAQLTPAAPQAQSFAPATVDRPLDPRGEERVRMPKLRQVIATRLKQAQHSAALLTTFNEVNMQALINIRSEYKDKFEKKYESRLGYMSFFVRAVTTALAEIPAVNAEIFGNEIIYKNYYDISIAVGSPRGLVVPVVRDADKLSIAQIEQTIANYGKRARDGSLSVDEMMGGTFTLTNGGVFGSLMSTPIINPPQSAILGMHKIQKRPIVVDDEIIIAPMMYLALSYDHRIIDGRESVTFLVRIKEMLEDPHRMLMEI